MKEVIEEWSDRTSLFKSTMYILEVQSEPCQLPQFTLSKDRRYRQFVFKPVYEHVTSSFTLHQDSRSVPDDGSRSQSAAEFRRWAEYRPCDPAKPRPPASIFHEDERNLQDVTSEMLRHYRQHPTPPRTTEDYYSKYYATTYKRETDPRFQVFSVNKTTTTTEARLRLHCAACRIARLVIKF